MCAFRLPHTSLRLLGLLLLVASSFSTPAQTGRGGRGQTHPATALNLKARPPETGRPLPWLTAAQRGAIASPTVGMLVIDRDENRLYLYDGHTWLPLATTETNLLGANTLTANDGAASDFFGSVVAISGDYALIGASNKTIGSNSVQGAAYIFVRSGTAWTQQARLTASDGAASDQFGSSVAISGDYALVGAYHKTTTGFNLQQGAAYMFVRSGTTWTLQQQLTASDGAFNDYFGSSVAISGDYAIVGAFGRNYNQGAAYVFVRSVSSWTQQTRLTASDGATYDRFGWSVAISGAYTIVGAYERTVGNNSYQGSAYIFARSGGTWTQQQQLIATDGSANDEFGRSVAISGDYALVGAYNKTIGGNTAQGVAYVFARSGSTWTQQQQLIATDGGAYERFGWSVALSGDYAIMGAYQKPITKSNQGAAYIFFRSGSTWTQQQRLIASDANVDDRFGYSVAISGNYSIMGAYTKTIGSNSAQGAAYVFSRTGTIWSETGGISLTSTLKAGLWNDPTVWSGGLVPTTTDVVAIGHAVSLPASYTANVHQVRYTTGGRLNIGVGAARLRLWP